MNPISIGDVLDDKYEIEGLLGEGAMGVVFSARHRGLNKPVAVKTLRPEIAQDVSLVGRFEQEARAASAIGHPNIIEVFDLGEAPNGARYMVMEHLQGEALSEIIIRQPLVPWERAAFLLGQVLSALSAAHKRGIVHRDLKPENIFVVHAEDRPDLVKLLDFGISKVIEEIADPSISHSRQRATRFGTVLGTPLYMSPEQAQGLTDIDHRSDLWAVAVCLYELVCGRPPFDGENYNQIMGAILQGKFPAPRQVNAKLPPAIEQVIVKGLGHEPAERYQSASEMRAALEHAVAQAKSSATTARGGAATAPRVAAPVSQSSGAAADAGLAESATGLAAAASAGGAGDDAAMLSALDRIAGGDVEIALGSSAEPDPRAAVAPPTPSPAPSSAGGPAPAAVPQPPAAADMFAPPDSSEKDLELDLAVSDPTLERVRANVQRSAPAAPTAAASSGAMRRPTGATAVARPGGGPGKVVIAVVLLALVGGGGVYAYKHFTTETVELAVVPIELHPAAAELIVDKKSLPGRQLELTPGESRTVRALFAGRLQREVEVTATEGGEQPPLVLRLYHRLPELSPRFAPAVDQAGAELDAGQVDSALDELRSLAVCVGELGAALAATRDEYQRATRGKARNIKRNSVPKIILLPGQVTADCRSASELAAAAQPSMPEVEKAMAELVSGLGPLEELLAELHDYYDRERFHNDKVRWGRKQHPIISGQLADSWTAHRKVANLVADRRAAWDYRELAALADAEGEGAHFQVRRLALTAQAWVGCLAREMADADCAKRAGILRDRYQAALEYAAANAAAMQEIDGAGIYLTALGKLNELAGGGGAATTDAVEVYNQSIEAFNEMVL